MEAVAIVEGMSSAVGEMGAQQIHQLPRYSMQLVGNCPCCIELASQPQIYEGRSARFCCHVAISTKLGRPKHCICEAEFILMCSAFTYSVYG